MRFMYLVLFTFTFSLILPNPARAEIPYAQKILLSAEYDRAEATLKIQVDRIKDSRENIKKGKATFDEARQITEALYVFALESLHRQNSPRFVRLAHLLNNDETRNRFYYPVRKKGGFSGDDLRYVSWKDEKCVSPVIKKDIKVGVYIEVDGGPSERFNFDGTQLIFIENYVSANDGKQSIKSYPLVKLNVSEGSPIYPLLGDLENLSTDLTQYYNCSYIAQFQKLERDNKKLNARYLQLAKLLNKTPIDFQAEKKEKTLVEDLLELSSKAPQKAVKKN